MDHYFFRWILTVVLFIGLMFYLVETPNQNHHSTFQIALWANVALSAVMLVIDWIKKYQKKSKQKDPVP